jgi:hypothetical protein
MNSLNKRLDTIEELLTLDNDIVSKLKRIEETKKKERIDAMNDAYKAYLNETLINSVNPVIGTSDFINVLICTIKYVKINNHNISRTLNFKPSQELEVEMAVHFIQSVYGDSFDDEFIRSSILPIERLLYPISQHKEEPPPHEVEEKTPRRGMLDAKRHEKKGFFSKNK